MLEGILSLRVDKLPMDFLSFCDIGGKNPSVTAPL